MQFLLIEIRLLYYPLITDHKTLKRLIFIILYKRIAPATQLFKKNNIYKW